MFTDKTTKTLEELQSLAIKLGQKLGTAESCTGGLVGAALSSLPGSSAYYLGGVVSYANSVKQAALGVDPQTLTEFGAVSREVAAEMAKGAAKFLGADIAVSVTGIAGPTGGSDAKPVGTVCFGLAAGAKVQTFLLHFDGERDQVRCQAVEAALKYLLDSLKEI